jgi:integrase
VIENGDLLTRVVQACQAAIGTALRNPSEALGVANGLRSALDTLNLVAGETAKGEAGLRPVVDNAGALTQNALATVLAHTEGRVDPNGIDVSAAMASLEQPVPPPSKGHVKPGKGIPYYSQVSADYIAMRKAAGAKQSELDTLQLRRKTFIDILGDRLVTDYFPLDLQHYVLKMRHWPANVTKRFDKSKGKPGLDDWNTNDVLATNADLHQKPVARKTMTDGYVANVRTMIRYGMSDYTYRDPFAGAKIRWPAEFRVGAPREGIDFEVLNKLFANGVASGCLDEALIPLILYLTSRRLGLILYLRGSDLRRKHGAVFAQTAGIVSVNGVWQRVPVKTDESMGSFVLHGLLDAIGFVDWSMARGDSWIFEAMHEHSDPSKYASQLLNRRLVAAGAKGASIETIHSLRGDGIDGLRDADIAARASQLQSGHAFGNLHDEYGHRSLSRKEAIAIATRALPAEIDWSVFENLDFDKLAAGRRTPGRRGEN